MQIEGETFTVHKRFALRISRGTTAQTTNLWVRLREEGIEGWGEASPFSIEGKNSRSSDDLWQELQVIRPIFEALHPWKRQEIAAILTEVEVSSSLRAAVDMALHDWMGKRVGAPLWQLWGLERNGVVPTSVTIGINSPAGAKERVRDWQQFMGAKVLKIKLGSPEGIEADQRMLLAVREEAPTASLSVDANGGWSLPDAVKMCHWLAQQGVKYVEQPLAVGEEGYLKELSSQSPLPIFVDESCFTSCDIPPLAEAIQGINIKIMKSGGLSEAMRMIHTAKAWGLQVMFGCYSDSALANTAMAHLSPLADYLDLDSHLNLLDDPFKGASLEAGRLIPNELTGLGVRSKSLTGKNF